MTQMEKLRQLIAADKTKVDELTQKYSAEVGRLKARISTNEKKYIQLENAALLAELRSISLGAGSNAKEIIRAIKDGDADFINQVLKKKQAEKQMKGSDENE